MKFEELLKKSEMDGSQDLIIVSDQFRIESDGFYYDLMWDVDDMGHGINIKLVADWLKFKDEPLALFQRMDFNREHSFPALFTQNRMVVEKEHAVDASMMFLRHLQRMDYNFKQKLSYVFIEEMTKSVDIPHPRLGRTPIRLFEHDKQNVICTSHQGVYSLVKTLNEIESSTEPKSVEITKRERQRDVIEIDVKVNLSLWSAIKMRIAGVGTPKACRKHRGVGENELTDQPPTPRKIKAKPDPDATMILEKKAH